MLSNVKIGVILPLLLGGCTSGGGYGDTPRLSDPSRAMVEEAPPAGYIPPPAYAPVQPASGYELQGDYPPEPGVERDVPLDVAPARSGPGASYAQPGAVQRPAPPQYRPAPEPVREPLPIEMPPAVAQSSGPRGTSGEVPRYDAVGYASWYGEEMGGGRTASGQPFDPAGMTAAHRTLPLGSFVEVTALDTGRTILVLINDRGPGAADREIDLSRGAAQQLGLNATAPVRVRLVSASPQDQMALRSGRAAAARIDAPQPLLTALRRKLPARAGSRPVRPAAAPVRPGAAYTPPVVARDPVPGPVRGTAGLFVQVAALSNEAKAKALATSLQGRVQRVGAIYRVQIGPFANAGAAQRARDDVARRGYGDARIVKTN